MSAVPPETYLTRSAAAAREAELAETDFRRRYTEELAAFEKKRINAFRRNTLLKALSSAIEGAEDEKAAFAAGERVLTEEFGLEASNEAHKPILEAFRPVSDAIDTILNCEDEPDHEAVLTALETFEKWYEARSGTPFMALYDSYSPETPVVDF